MTAIRFDRPARAPEAPAEPIATDENLHLVWAELFVDALAQAGVMDVVLCPGSRATPFVLAAANEPRLRCHDLVDERAAAFFALGQARATGRPSLCVYTSGTAGAHAYPAVIEAAHAHVPMIVLTADRPPELQRCGAPQTIDQTRLYGVYARQYADLGLPDGSAPALAALRRTAAALVARTRGPVPGPFRRPRCGPLPCRPRRSPGSPR